MLTGILHPSSGSIEVLGLVPWKNRHALGYKIGTVFGQRTQLWHHLPPAPHRPVVNKPVSLLGGDANITHRRRHPPHAPFFGWGLKTGKSRRNNRPSWLSPPPETPFRLNRKSLW